MSDLPGLTVVFDSRRHLVPTHGDGLVFGRQAELDIDNNPFLSRAVGRFRSADGQWWLEHLGSAIRLSITSGSVCTMMVGGGHIPLVHDDSLIRFRAGAANYELVALLDPAPRPLRPLPPPATSATVTGRPVDLPLNDDQLLLLLVLAEPRLRDPTSPAVLPSNAAAARELNWSKAKFDRKLDWLCARLARDGISELKGTRGRATGRRHRLVDFVIDHGYVTGTHLQLLDAHRTSTTRRDVQGDHHDR